MDIMDQVRRHLKLEPDDISQDEELNLFLASATEYVEKYIGHAITGDNDALLADTPMSVISAILLVVGDLDANRDAQIVGTIRADNPTVERLLHFHRTGMGI